MTRAVLHIKNHKTNRTKMYSAPVTVLESFKERMFTDMLIHMNVERSVDWINRLVNDQPHNSDLMDRPVRLIPMEVPYDVYLDTGRPMKSLEDWDQILKECKNRIQ